ncbi:MAG TPA: hypothetical protein VEF72_25975 [Mycobacterium sp.]|nr:hypothetical protein [Mycobacterium sp.]
MLIEFGTGRPQHPSLGAARITLRQWRFQLFDGSADGYDLAECRPCESRQFDDSQQIAMNHENSYGAASDPAAPNQSAAIAVDR